MIWKQKIKANIKIYELKNFKTEFNKTIDKQYSL